MNIPNALSIFRLALVPVFAAVFLSKTENAFLWSGLIFAAAGVTDALDGMIARKYGQITKLGRVLDPLADKVMVLTALLCCGVRELLPLWVAGIYFAKELLVLMGGLLFYRQTRDMPSSNLLGKSATVVFVIVILTVILFPSLSYEIKMSMMVAALILTIAAFIGYVLRLSTWAKKR